MFGKSRAICLKNVDCRGQHMNIVNLCHFQLKGGAKSDALIAKVVAYVDSLLRTCSEAQSEL